MSVKQKMALAAGATTFQPDLIMFGADATQGRWLHRLPPGCRDSALLRFCVNVDVLSQTQKKVEGFNAGADDYLTSRLNSQKCWHGCGQLLRRNNAFPRLLSIVNNCGRLLVPERFE